MEKQDLMIMASAHIVGSLVNAFMQRQTALRKVEQHQEVMEWMNRNNETFQNWMKYELTALEDASEKEENRRAEIEEEMTRALTELVEKHHSLLQEAESENYAKLEDLEHNAAVQKEALTTRQTEEMTELRKHQESKNDEAVKIINKLREDLGKRIDEDKKHYFEEEEKTLQKQHELINASKTNEEGRMQERRELENNNDEIIRTTNQLKIEHQNNVEQIENVEALMKLEWIKNMENARNIDLKKANLKVIKSKGSSINGNVNELYHKLDVPLKMKNITSLKKNALSAKIQIKTLENDTLSLKNTLEVLHQSNDEERKYLAEEALKNLTSIISSVSSIANIVEERDNLNLESSQYLTECLESMKTENEKMISNIYKIPEYSDDNVFTKKCNEYISAMSNPDMLRNIELGYIQDGSVADEE